MARAKSKRWSQRVTVAEAFGGSQQPAQIRAVPLGDVDAELSHQSRGAKPLAGAASRAMDLATRIC
jgi:hypothetical protein